MIRCLFLLYYATLIDTKHFDGGTISWMPIDPYANSSSTTISIMQSYWWTYPTMTCTTNVPISTSGRNTTNTNLTCVVDCSTDGGYSTKPVNILTDCTSVSSSLGMMTSQRSHNISLTAGAYFYLANVGSAWAALNYPTQSNLEWSIVTFIDLRLRPDGFINTAPVASVASPQYAFVNRTMQINIPVSDANAGDDVRCRWSTYTPGYRRRKRSYEEERINHESAVQFYEKVAEDREIIHIREKRSCAGGCNAVGVCNLGCSCTCSGCTATACNGSTCTINPNCINSTTVGTTVITTTTTTTTTTKTTTTTTTTKTTATTTTTKTTTTTTITTTTESTTPISTSTIDTPGTLQSTSSYPHRNAIDECGGICYPGSVPNGTTLSNCTITFTGLRAGTWYAVAIQVEDFINSTSTTPMSSVPVQLLIYVLPQPACSNAPIILPLTQCLEVSVGVSNSFNLSVLNLCNASVVGILDIIVSQGITGMQMSNVTISSTNASIVYKTFTWTPQTSQIGSQQLCAIAYTSEQLQSAVYCVTFNVITSLNVCGTTTTSTTTTSIISTSATVSATSATISATSATISATSVTVSATSATISATSATISATSVTVSATSTGTTLTSIVTSTGNSAPTNTMLTTTTSETTASTAKNTSGEKLYWGLIAGLSLLGLLLLSLFCYCCCVCCCPWCAAAKRRRQEEEEEEEEEDQWQHRYLSRPTEYMVETSPYTIENLRMQVPNKNYQAYNPIFKPNYIKTPYINTKSNPIITTIPKWPLYGVPATVQNMPFLRLPVTTGEKVHN